MFSAILVLTSCSNSPSFEPKGIQQFGDISSSVQEVRFKSNRFRIVGDLRFPSSVGQYPAIILVHGSGDATRDGAVNFLPLIELFLRNGYAVFSWDKPGSGDSKGDFDSGYTLTQRAQILAEGTSALCEHPQIDETNIGVWGVSQAGWVIPLALELTDKIAFMIVVGGGGEDSIEQMAYQVGQKVICDGGTTEQAETVERYWVKWTKAREYSEYKEALDAIIADPKHADVVNAYLKYDAE